MSRRFGLAMGTAGNQEDSNGDLSLGGLRSPAPALDRALARERLFGLGEAPTFDDRYRLSQRVGRGGMGDVYRATDVKLNRTVAIKVLSRDASATANAKARLVREALIMARVSNVHVVPVFDVGEADGRVFVAMEYVEGPTLRSWLSDRARPWRGVLGVMREAARGLAAAHAAGVIHRDFKPDNVMLDPDGRARVLDFGLASSTGAPPPSAQEAAAEDLDPTQPLTKTGSLMGTPAYMAPELFDGQPATRSSDQFAFCVTVYEALYGVRPFSDQRLLQRRMTGASVDLVPAPRGRDVPRAVRTAVERGLRSDPTERFPTMDDLIAALDRAPTGRPRAFKGLVVAALVIGGGASAAYGWQEYERRSCADADLHLAGVWDDGRREMARAQVLDTAVPYAGTTWQTVHDELDRYASSWVESHVDACTRTNVWHQQSEETMDLRLACLEGRLESMRSLVDVLQAADAAVVENAVSAVRGLPPIRPCEDAQWLRQRVKPPVDPDMAGSVASLRTEKTAVEALNSTAQYERALAQVRALTQRADEIDYAPLMAEVLLLTGELHLNLGDYEQARQVLREAFFAARRLGHSEVAARAAARLVAVYGDTADYERALDWVEHGDAELVGLPADTEAAALLRTGQGFVHLRQGAYTKALEAHWEALDRYESLSGPGAPEVAVTVLNVSAVLEAQGEYEEAAVQVRRALGVLESALGRDHPHTALAVENLGLIHFRQGKYPSAVALLSDAIGRREKTLGPSHVDLIGALNTIGLALRKQGHYGESMRHHQRALKIAEESLGATHPTAGLVCNNIGTLLAWQERFDEALVYYRRDLEIGLAAQGPDHISVALSLNNIGRVLEEKGQLDEALDHYRRSLETKRRAVGDEHPAIASSLYNVGRVLREQGRHEEALEHYRRSVAVTEAALSPDHPEIAQTLVDVGALLRDLQRPAESADAYARACGIAAKAEASPALFAAAQFGLARAQWASGAHESSLTHARIAIVAYAMVVEEDHADHIANIDAWLAAPERSTFVAP